jgi:hypothetical protein
LLAGTVAAAAMSATGAGKNAVTASRTAVSDRLDRLFLHSSLMSVRLDFAFILLSAFGCFLIR